MKPKNRRLFRVQLHLVVLEDRMQPGTILTTGLELGALADELAPSETKSSPIVRRTQNNDEVRTPAMETIAITTPSKEIAASRLAPRPTQIESRSSANPAIHSPQAAPYETLQVGHRTVRRTTVQQHAVNPATLVQKDFGGRFGAHTGTIFSDAVVEQGGGEGGSRAVGFATFDAPGTDRQDGVNDVVGGLGVHSGDTYSVGFQGRAGTMKRYDQFGTLEASTIFANSPGGRVQLHGVDVDVVGGAVYVVGRETTPSGVLIENFVHKVNGNLGGVVTPAARLIRYAAGGGVVTLEDIDSSAGDVHVTGTGNSGVGHDLVLDFRYDPNLMPRVENMWDFGSDSEGHAIAGDSATGIRVIGTSMDPGDGIHRPGWFAVAADDVNMLYAFVTDAGSPTDKATNAMFGVEISIQGLHLSGSVADSVLNEAMNPDPDNYDNLFIAGGVPLDTGHIQLGNYAFTYAIPGGDYLSHGSAIDVATGAHFTGGWADEEGSQNNPQSMSYGDISQFDVGGMLVAFRAWGDLSNALDADSDGMGVSLLTTGNVATGGRTDAGSPAAPSPMLPLTGGDTMFGSNGRALQGPPRDGYVMVDNVPVGFLPGTETG